MSLCIFKQIVPTVIENQKFEANLKLLWSEIQYTRHSFYTTTNKPNVISSSMLYIHNA